MTGFLGLPHWFWHPLGPCTGNACGYNFWSGIGSDVGEVTTLGIFVTLVSMAVGLYRKHNCHVHRCWRLQWHVHPGHGHPVCELHHPDGKGRAEHLHPFLHRWG